RVEDAFAVLIGDRYAFGIGVERRFEPGFLDDAVVDREVNLVGFFAGGDDRSVDRGNRLARLQCANRGAVALAAAEGAQQAAGAATRYRRVMGVGDVDGPRAFADRDAGDRHRV